MSSSDVTLSQKTLSRIEAILREQRSAFKDDMDRVLSKMGHTTGGALAGFGGFFGGGGNLKQMKSEIQSLTSVFKNNSKTLSAYEQYMLKSADRQMKALNKMIAAEEEAAKAQEQNTNAQNNNTEAQNKNSGVLRRGGEHIKDFSKGLVEGYIAVKGFKEAVDEIRTSYKHGFNWNPFTDVIQGIKMGMDPKEFMEFQAQFRRTSNAMAGGMDEFNSTVSNSQSEMIQYTGSLKSAAQAMGNMYELSHSMGLGFDDVGKSANDLFSQFKRMNTATSMTIDQFTDLTRSLVDDQDIRQKLLSLQQQQRGTYIQSLLKQHDLLMAQGMTFEAAQKLVKYVESASNKNPLERMKQGAQMLQFSQMLGFSGADARRLMYLNNKRNKTAEEVDQFTSMMKELTKRANTATESGIDVNGTRYGEIAIRTLQDKMGLDLSPYEEGAAQESAQRNPAAMAAHQAEIAERSEDWLQQIFKQAVIITDMLSAWGGSALGTIAAGVAGAILMKKGGFGDLFGKTTGVTGAGRTGFQGRMMGGLKGLGAGAVVAGAGMTAAGFIDPSSYETAAGRTTATAAQGALQGASMGAGVGMMFGPWGALIGGGLGALAGTAKALYDNATNSERKVKDSMAASTELGSLEEARITVRRNQLQDEISNLKMQGKLTEDQMKYLKDKEQELSGVNTQLSVEQMRTQFAAAGNAAKALGHDRGHLDTSEDVQRMLSLRGVVAKQAGLGNQDYSDRFQQLALKHVANTGSSKLVTEYNKALADMNLGKKVEFSDELQKAFEGARLDLDKMIAPEAAKKQVEIASSAPTDFLSSTVHKSVDQRNQLDEKIAELEKQKESMKGSSLGSYFGFNPAEDQINKQLDELRQQRDIAAQGVRDMQSVINGNASLLMRLSDEDRELLSQISGNRPKPKSNAAHME